MSRFGTQRLVAKAIEYAIKARRPSVTLVHKGNIMKFTEGAFREWGYEVAREKFDGQTISESEAGKGKGEKGKVVSRTASRTRCSSRCCCAGRIRRDRHAQSER